MEKPPLPETKQSSKVASHTSGTILFGFAAVSSCLQLLDAATKMQASHGRFARLAGDVFLLAVLIAFGLTQLLLFSYVRALGASAVGEDASRRRFLGRLAKAILLTAVVALLAGAAMCLVASGYLGGGADDVGWQHRKK